MKQIHRDPNIRFKFHSEPPTGCDEVIKSKIQIDEDGQEFSTVTVEKRDFTKYDGIMPRDFSIAVLQRSNPAALAVCDKKLTRDRFTAMDNLQAEAEAMTENPMLNPQTESNE